MKISHLNNMVKGWFVGQFQPTLLATNCVEVAVKYYKAGDYETSHHHEIATELTVIISGEVEMNGRRYSAGQIIVIEPRDVTDFRAVTDVATTVVKVPCVAGDKYQN
jgi:hypothetical protein